MTGGRSEVYSAEQPGWGELLSSVPHDVFHRAEYHRLSGFGHEGEPCLFAYREAAPGGGGVFLWPYLKREIPGSPWHDVSSVYGYAGPVCRGGEGEGAAEEFARRGCQALLAHWRESGVIAAFTRFHPLLANAGFAEALEFAGPGGGSGRSPAGTTVSIDLTIPLEDQVRRYQKVLRQEIRKARESGFVTIEDQEFADAPSFVRLYRQTMERRNSRADYLIDEAWVEQFRAALGSHARLFVTKWNGQVAAALLAIEYAPFLHAHLTGINADLAAHSPLKILLDDIRIWGSQRGLSSFHLGGGLGGREDSLFQFKRRFSPVTHPFQTGRWVLDRSRYEELERAHRDNLAARGYRVGNDGFFPIYRYQPTPADALEEQASEV